MSEVEITEKMYLLLKQQAPDSTTCQLFIRDWLYFVRLLSSPTSVRINQLPAEPFDFERICEQVSNLEKEQSLTVTIKSDEQEFYLEVTAWAVIQRVILVKSVYLSAQALIDDYFERQLENYGLYGYIRSFDEFLYHNVTVVAKRHFESAEELAKLPKIYDAAAEVAIDGNQLAGNDLYLNGLCITSCWKMYFSAAYYQLIPKPLLQEVQRVHDIQQLAKDGLCITLFENPFAWTHHVNLADQRYFRDQVGIDQLVWNNGVGVLREPYIDYVFSEHLIQTVQYQNRYWQAVPKSQATNFLTRNYYPQTQKYTEQRLKGRLNAKAYFPWIDVKQERMLNYRVLDPSRTLDAGASAYEFYIREALTLEKVDQAPNNFQAVLYFYVPTNMLEKIPLTQLKRQLADRTICNEITNEQRVQFDLKLALNELQVVFLDQQELPQLEQKLTAELQQQSFKHS